MTAQRDFDRQLATWFDERAVGVLPADLLARSLARVGRVAQRPGLLTRDRWIRGAWRLGAGPLAAPALLLLLLLVAAILIVAGSQLVKRELTVIAPAPSTVPEASLPGATTLEPAPTTAPGPLGGGEILGFKSSADRHGPFDVLEIDPSTGGTTLLGQLPVSGSCCGYQILRNADLTHVVIVDGTLQDATRAADQFGFASFSNDAVGYEWLTLSPAGDRIAGIRVDSHDTPVEIVITNLAGAVQTRLPIPAAMSWGGPLVWAPDGQSLLLAGCRPCNKAATPTQQQTAHHSHLYIVPVDGSQWRELLDLDNGQLNAAWSPDGTRLAVEGYPCANGSFMPRCDPAETRDTLSVVEVSSGSETTLFQDLPAIGGVGWSPDGTQLAFAALDGTWVVDVANSARTRVDDAHSFSADWSPDGLWLLIGHEGPGTDTEHVVVRSDGSSTQIVLRGYMEVTW